MQQASIAVHADVASHAGQFLDSVLPGRLDAVRLDGGVEQLRHRRLDDVARAPADLPRRAAQAAEDRRNRPCGLS
jgi:hypothetical protein